MRTDRPFQGRFAAAARAVRALISPKTLGAGLLFLLLATGLAVALVADQSKASDLRQARAELREKATELHTARAISRRALRQLQETRADLRWAQAEARGDLLVAKAKDPYGDDRYRAGPDIRRLTAGYDSARGEMRLTISFYERTWNQDVATTEGGVEVGSRDGHTNPLWIGVNLGSEDSIDWEACRCLTYTDTYTLKLSGNKRIEGDVHIRWNALRTEVTAAIKNPLLRHAPFVQAATAYYWNSQHMPTTEWLADKTTRVLLRKIG